MIQKVSDFKTRFNEALEIRNMKPVDLSEITGISEATLSQYRSGYSKPKEERLAILSNALKVNPVWLLGLNVNMELPLSEEEAEENREFVELFTDSTPDVRSSVVTLLKSSKPKP